MRYSILFLLLSISCQRPNLDRVIRANYEKSEYIKTIQHYNHINTNNTNRMSV